ncbi:MAG: ATP-binding protein [Bacteroidales bacterium]|nr:ATP-binding protein [Bacteroidales bacterium]
MKELSLHILDIVQNSLHAGATEIEVTIAENLHENLFSVCITDNGHGIPAKELLNLQDPFFTTKKKKTGLGIPLLKQHAEMAGGNIEIKSEVGKGTTITATFEHNHFDRQPMGNIAGTITGIIRANPETRFIYKHSFNDKEFALDTTEIKTELEDIPINSNEVLRFIQDYIHENLNKLYTK